MLAALNVPTFGFLIVGYFKIAEAYLKDDCYPFLYYHLISGFCTVLALAASDRIRKGKGLFSRFTDHQIVGIGFVLTVPILICLSVLEWNPSKDPSEKSSSLPLPKAMSADYWMVAVLGSLAWGGAGLAISGELNIQAERKNRE
jgi:hypothetical protein